MGLAVYAGIIGLMMSLEKSLIFFPASFPHGDWAPAELEFEDVFFSAGDGTKLHGWYVPAPHARGTLLLAHGNAGNLTGRADKIRLFQQRLHLNVFAFDYRGYGKSEGSPSEAGIIDDGQSALNWLAKHKGVESGRVVLYGESLGGGVMVDLASRSPCRALILESTFTSLPDVAASVFPWIPVRWLMRHRLDSASKIGRVSAPLLQLHGQSDRVIPFAIGQRLFQQAREPKQLVALPLHDHNDPLPDEWIEAMAAFLDRCPEHQEK
jgi:fermentation-respiration switch protein FrsA (DUF1100 family)